MKIKLQNIKEYEYETRIYNKLKKILQNFKNDEFNSALEYKLAKDPSNSFYFIDLLINAEESKIISDILKLSKKYNVNKIVSYDMGKVLEYNKVIIDENMKPYKHIILIWASDIKLLKLTIA